MSKSPPGPSASVMTDVRSGRLGILEARGYTATLSGSASGRPALIHDNVPPVML